MSGCSDRGSTFVLVGQGKLCHSQVQKRLLRHVAIDQAHEQNNAVIKEDGVLLA